MLVILIIEILCCLKHIQITKDWEFFLGYLRIFSPKVYEFYHISFREKLHNFSSLYFQEFVFQEFVFPEFVFQEFVFQEFVSQEFVMAPFQRNSKEILDENHS